MASLFGLLHLGAQSLSTQQFGLQVTGQNIANVNTPGYTRQRPIITDDYYFHTPFGDLGRGSRIDGIESYRNLFVERRMREEEQALGSLRNQIEALSQVEAILVPGDGGIQDGLQKFFLSLRQLSADPSNLTLRTGVVIRAQELAGRVRQSYEQLQNVQSVLDSTVVSRVAEINGLTTRIAMLNGHIAAAGAQEANSSSARDEREQLIRQLAERMGIVTYENNRGEVTVQTEGGHLLVSGPDARSLEVSSNPATPFRHVFADGVDITGSITGGGLGGVLTIRDRDVPQYLSELDSLAFALSSEFNALHRAGFDLNGVTGNDFFRPFVPPAPGDYTGAARALEVLIVDPAGFAAALNPGVPGENTNVLAMIQLEDQPMPVLAGQNMAEWVQRSLTRVGVDLNTRLGDLRTRETVMSQLEDMRDAVSGVSLDEEAVRLVEFQAAYEAIARYISIIDRLTSDLVQTLGR